MARSTFVYAIFLRTTPEKLWLALTEAENLAWWLSPDGGGKATHVETDARVGGGIRFVAYREGRAVVHSGEYLEVQRPRRLSFTLRNSASEVTERVTFLIEPRNDGCLLTVTRIEPAPLQALAPMVPLATYRAEKAARPRKAAFSQSRTATGNLRALDCQVRKAAPQGAFGAETTSGESQWLDRRSSM